MLSTARRARSVLVVGLLLPLVALLLPSPATSQTCEAAPVLRDANVNQNLPYATLVAGKDTTAKLHLTTNGCAGTVKVTGGTLTVAGPSGVASVGLFQVPLGNVAGCCAAQPNSDGDPKFFLNGEVLTAAQSEPFSVTLTAQLSYTVSTSAGAKSVTFTAEADGEPLVRTFVGTRPIRTLFAPLGRPADGRAAWWPDSAKTELQKAVLTASRFDPVRRGVCSPIQPVGLAAASCGHQYSIYEGLIDVSEFVEVVKGTPTFTGTLVGFSTIRKRLGDALQAYNLANPDRAADLVVGAVIESRSAAPPAAQGVAQVGGRESWIRLVTDVAGGLLGQEQKHNFGLKVGSSIHADALGTQFDGGSERAHDPVTTLFIPDDRTLLQRDPLNSANAPWNNATVGLEGEDWLCLLGSLAPGASPCGAKVISSPAGAGGDVLSITGNTDLTPAGSDFRTAVSDSASCLTEADDSPLAVRYLDGDGNPLGGDIPLPASDLQTHPDEGTGTWMVDCTVEWDDRAQTVQILAEGSAVWSVDASTAAPGDVEVRVRPAGWSHANESNDAQHQDVDAALSPGATGSPTLLAWVKHDACSGDGSGRLIVKRLSDASTASRCLSPAPEDPAIRPGNADIAYARAGNIEIIEVVQSPDGIAFGAVKTAFFCAPAGLACAEGEGTDPIRGPASDAAWDVDGNRLAFSVRQDDGGELAVIETQNLVPGVTVPRRVTLSRNVDEIAPSWSHTQGERDLLVFERCGPGAGGEPSLCGADASPLFTLDVQDGSGTLGFPAQTALGTTGNDPSWGSMGFIAAGQAGSSRIVLIHPEDAGRPGSTTLVTGGDTGFTADAFDPSLHANGPVAFQSEGEIHVASSAGNASEISVTAEDDNPAVGYAHVYNRCGVTGEAKPMDVGLAPSSIEGTQIAFHTVVDLSGTCGGGTVRAIVSDGENTSTNQEEPALGSEEKSQTPAIGTPLSGSTLFNSDPLTLDGAMLDPEQGGEASGSPESPIELEWLIDGNPVGSGARLAIQPGGPAHALGTHTVELRATDRASGSSSGDGAALAADAGCIAPACTSTTTTYTMTSRGTAIFDPNTWQVPSNGVVTYSVRPTGIDLRKITTAEILEVDQAGLNDAARWGANVANGTWVATQVKVQGDTLVLKFDRNACTPLTTGGTCLGPNQFFTRNDLLTGGYVRLTVQGSGGGVEFRLSDPAAPILQPA